MKYFAIENKYSKENCSSGYAIRIGHSITWVDRDDGLAFKLGLAILIVLVASLVICGLFSSWPMSAVIYLYYQGFCFLSFFAIFLVKWSIEDVHSAMSYSKERGIGAFLVRFMVSIFYALPFIIVMVSLGATTTVLLLGLLS